MKTKLFVISDLHLEKKNDTLKQFIIDNINRQINLTKDSNITPILLCAGDVHNGSEGLPWLEKIQAKVIYICGNHEFWENDYLDVFTKINNNLPNNVTFLNNDFIELEDYIIVGTTLWTNVGSTLNKNLLDTAEGVMRDSFKITYKDWYTDENIQRLSKIMSDYTLKSYVEKKQWNVLAEQDENKKAVDFYESFGIVHDFVKEINKDIIRFKNKNETSENLIILENYQELSLLDFLNSLNDNLANSYARFINKIDANFSFIYEKLKYVDINKPMVSMSHHLPFYEEVMVATNEMYKASITSQYNTDIYSEARGFSKNQAYQNYRHSRDSSVHKGSVVESIHYCNDGHNNIDFNYINKLTAWVHGHDHYLDYQDYLKGIAVITNPIGDMDYIFETKNNKVSLNENIKKIKNIKSDVEEEKEIIAITNHLREIKLSNNNDIEKREIISAWILKNYNFSDYEKEYNFLNKEMKKLYTILIKNPKLEYDDADSKLNHSIESLSKSINYTIDKIHQIEKELKNAYGVRINIDYCITTDNKFNNDSFILDYIQQKYTYDSHIGYELNSMLYGGSSFLYSHNLRQALNNCFVIENNISKFKKFKKVINSIPPIKIYELNLSHLENFVELAKKQDKSIRSDLFLKNHEILVEKYTSEEVKEASKKMRENTFNF